MQHDIHSSVLPVPNAPAIYAISDRLLPLSGVCQIELRLVGSGYIRKSCRAQHSLHLINAGDPVLGYNRVRFGVHLIDGIASGRMGNHYYPLRPQQ